MMYIGIDLGGTNIAVGLVNEEGKILHKDSVPTNSSRPNEEILKDMAMLSIKVVKDAGYTMDDVKSVGVGSPGTCDDKNGVVLYANNLGFDHVPVREEIQKYIDKPVYIGNDANVAALAEYYASENKPETFVAITLGTGVGGGIVLGGKIHTGAGGGAGELGHIMLMHGGEQCSCGRKGCWEAYASATALKRQTRIAIAQNPDSIMNEMIEGNLNNVSGKTAFDAAKKGDTAGQAVVDKYIEYVAVGISDVINIFQPELIVIGGGICKEGDYLLNPIKEYCFKEKYGNDDKAVTEIAIAKLGNDAGIIGAALLGIR